MGFSPRAFKKRKSPYTASAAQEKVCFFKGVVEQAKRNVSVALKAVYNAAEFYPEPKGTPRLLRIVPNTANRELEAYDKAKTYLASCVKEYDEARWWLDKSKV